MINSSTCENNVMIGIVIIWSLYYQLSSSSTSWRNERLVEWLDDLDRPWKRISISFTIDFLVADGLGFRLEFVRFLDDWQSRKTHRFSVKNFLNARETRFLSENEERRCLTSRNDFVRHESKFFLQIDWNCRFEWFERFQMPWKNSTNVEIRKDKQKQSSPRVKDSIEESVLWCVGLSARRQRPEKEKQKVFERNFLRFYFSNERHDQFGVDRFSWTRFASNDHRLFFTVDQQISKSFFSDGKNVRRVVHQRLNSTIDHSRKTELVKLTQPRYFDICSSRHEIVSRYGLTEIKIEPM